MSNVGAGFMSPEEGRSDYISQTSELSQNQKKTKEDTVIEELGSQIDWGKYRTVPQYRRRVDAFFSESEIEEMRQSAEEEVEVEELSYSEMWDGIQQDHREKVLKPQVAEHFRKQSESTETPKWMKGKDSKKVSELTGSEFRELIQEANQTDIQSEELSEFEKMRDSEEVTPDFDKIEIKELDSETAELAASGFEQRAKDSGKDYWTDIAQDVKHSSEIGDTESSSITSDKKHIKTSNSEMMAELRQFDADPDIPVKIIKDNGSAVEAELDKGAI